VIPLDLLVIPMRLSAAHILIVVVVLLLLFGASRLPVIAKSLGQSLKIFKKEVSELAEDTAPKPTAEIAPATPAAPAAPATPPPATPPAADSAPETPPQA
jgi:sec-independent protein translocase protein TatA